MRRRDDGGEFLKRELALETLFAAESARCGRLDDVCTQFVLHAHGAHAGRRPVAHAVHEALVGQIAVHRNRTGDLFLTMETLYLLS